MKKELKCIDCKKTFQPHYRNNILASKRCLTCLLKHNKKKKAESAKKLREIVRARKQNTNSYWGKKCWKVFVDGIKKQRSSFQGYASCYTCAVVKPVKELQGGHCFHRGRGGWRRIDFDPKHIHLQCAKCNMFGGGSIPRFTYNLIQDFGESYYKELEKGSREPALSVEELKKLYEELK